MKIVTIILLLVAAVFLIVIFGTIMLAAFAMRCENCPNKEKCENDPEFHCPFDNPADYGNIQGGF